MIKNKIFLILIFVIILGIALYGLLPSFSNENLLPLECNLNKENCEYKFKDKMVKISLNPKPLQAMDITHLVVENLPEFENLKLELYGLNMDMGKIKPRLIRLENGNYISKIVLSLCSLEQMRFRGEFIQDNKPIGLHFDFDLTNR
ncbi:MULTISPECIES: hypothetical protein [unclassified Campylobacter]|uniref:hypothetical protein n=1 Tax=unclassified Campylobacter TaxID=2593542 RepID=UPI0012380C3F|nr:MULTISPECIES: hypothetical protein [unclassified Campylobacter]KAA6224732.1 hypothetical protein FMM54_07780 [Campylobacter sp. LR185c]KAA6225729.1 hypothetical protein FMM57_07560 [Campylobacter sp. LR286c]KAA6225850.1 hypothetical protein FMM55_06235 [Campylobacter sp. LR196d]KAA6229702.1 hypothetical protein FMM58_07315 [Campylobacter sp. LR291e]KAA6230052.1 hypothetical protein FMM56_06470 [Campylobacter sp. LR264d]